MSDLFEEMKSIAAEPHLVSTKGKSNGLSFKINLVLPEPPKEPEEIDDCLSKCYPKGKFNIWASTYILTYKYHLIKEEVVNWFTKLAAERKMKDIIVRVSHETGSKKVPYLHSHVFVDFGAQFKSTNPRVFDNHFTTLLLVQRAGTEADNWHEPHFPSDQPHPNIGPICKRQHLNRIYKYMCKEDHSNDDMLEWIQADHLVEDYWEHDNVHDALRMAKRPSDIPGILAAYNARPQAGLELIPFEFVWQQHLFESVCNGSSKRDIHWVYDHVGGMGKSDFVKMAMSRFGKKCLAFTQFGGARDAATVVNNHLDTGGSPEVVLIDLPRGAEDKAIYEPIEMIKNGLITAIKYNGATRCFNNRVVVVFANFLPRLDAMTIERWKIWNREKHEDYFKHEIDEFQDGWNDDIHPSWESGYAYVAKGPRDFTKLIEDLTADEQVMLYNRLYANLSLLRMFNA